MRLYREGQLPVGVRLEVDHFGVIGAVLKRDDTIVEQWDYLQSLYIWDCSISDVGLSGKITYIAVPPRLLGCLFKDGQLVVVEAEYI